MEKAKYTTVTFGSFCRDQATMVKESVAAAVENSFLQPCEVGAAPIGGSCEVFLTTRYVFADENGQDVEDNEKSLMDHMLYVLACELTVVNHQLRKHTEVPRD